VYMFENLGLKGRAVSRVHGDMSIPGQLKASGRKEVGSIRAGSRRTRKAIVIVDPEVSHHVDEPQP
jgi:hypothetical protein